MNYIMDALKHIYRENNREIEIQHMYFNKSTKYMHIDYKLKDIADRGFGKDLYNGLWTYTDFTKYLKQPYVSRYLASIGFIRLEPPTEKALFYGFKEYDIKSADWYLVPVDSIIEDLNKAPFFGAS